MYKLLVVEDEKLMAEYLKEIIDWHNAGFEIAGTAYNGKEGLEFLESHTVDVILTDIRMPVVDGLELARCVKSRYPSIIVVLMTAYGEFEYAREGIKIGITDYLLKSDEEESIEKCFAKVRSKLDIERRIQSVSDEHKEEGLRPGKNPVLLRCLSFIEENYHRDIGLSELSWHTHIHEKHISRLFSQELGKPFTAVLMEKRIETAKVYLTMTDMKMYEIAELTGYKTSAYFSKKFREAEGITPLEYRRRYLVIP